MRLFWAAPVATVSGVLFFLSFPATDWWPGAILGVAGFAAATFNQRARHGLWLGLLFGSAFWLPLINWLSLYLGPIPWLALSFMMILWFVLLGTAVAFVTTAINKTHLSIWAKISLNSISFAGLWVIREAVQSNFPYDGFAWGRLAHTQADGPLLNFVAWIGFAGLSGLLALVAVVPVATTFVKKSKPKQTLIKFAVSVTAISALIFIISLIPVPTIDSVGTANIVGIQGNSKSGVFDDRESGDVIADHLRVTREWIDADPLTAKKADVVVWPENSAEFNLPWNRSNLSAVRELAEELDASFALGSVLGEDINGERLYTNSSIILEPGTEALGRFDKRNPVPFAEYMPHRAFYRALVPDLVDMVQLEYEHGVSPTVLPAAHMQAGLAICFDIIFDDHAVAMNSEGAQVVFAQTNNADFGQTDQSAQQLAIAKLRAVEMGRSLINISTVATSKIIAPDGTVLDSVVPWQPGVIQAEVELRDESTPAMMYGATIAGLLITAGFGGLSFAGYMKIRSRRQTNL